MKAAHVNHGSPPLARPNRHLSNSSHFRNKTCSGSKSHNQKTTMPPFLRLDSVGEVFSHESPQKVAHQQRTNTCRQGASPSAASARGGVWGKLMARLGPQPDTSSDLLNPSQIQSAVCALDDLLNRRQTFDGVAMAGKPSHVKMAQSSLPHLNRYGQWGSMCPNYLFLPQGVFPCHVFQAVHSQRDPLNTWSTSGQFVVPCGMFTSGKPMDAWSSKCSPGIVDLAPSKKMNTSSSSVDNQPRDDSKNCAAQTDATCECPVNKVCEEQSPRGANSDRANDRCTETENHKGSHFSTCKEENRAQQLSFTLRPRRCIFNISPSYYGDEKETNCKGKRTQTVIETSDSKSKMVPQEVENSSTKQVVEDESISQGAERADITKAYMNDVKEMVSSVDPPGYMKASNSNVKTDALYSGPQFEGAVCLEILKERNFCKPECESDAPRHHPVCECDGPVPQPVRESEKTGSPLVMLQCSQSTSMLSSADETSDWEDIEDQSLDDTWEPSKTESEEVWTCFMSNQLSLSNFLSALPKVLDHNKEASPEKVRAGEEQCGPKPCPAVTERWRQFYSPGPTLPVSCKVRFDCGAGKDTVYEYEKGDDETFTVMEIQKMKDLNRQHAGKASKLLQQSCAGGEHKDGPSEGSEGIFAEKVQGDGEEGTDLQDEGHASKLLQKSCSDGECDDDITEGESQNAVGLDRGAHGDTEEKAAANQVSEGDASFLLDEKDGDSEESDSEEEDCEESSDESEDDAEDGSDDDFIVFEDE